MLNSGITPVTAYRVNICQSYDLKSEEKFVRKEHSSVMEGLPFILISNGSQYTKHTRGRVLEIFLLREKSKPITKSSLWTSDADITKEQVVLCAGPSEVTRFYYFILCCSPAVYIFLEVLVSSCTSYPSYVKLFVNNLLVNFGLNKAKELDLGGCLGITSTITWYKPILKKDPLYSTEACLI